MPGMSIGSRIMLSFLFLFLAGCKVGEELNERLVARNEKYSELTQDYGRWTSREEFRVLDWDTAVKILQARNTQLRREQTRIENLKRERDEQWKTWLPQVGVYANLFSSLSELGNLAFSDPSIAVTAPLNIPDPVSEKARAFENALSYLQAIDNEKLTYRRLIARLHGIYSNAERLEARMKADKIETGSVAEGLRALESKEAYKEQMRGLSSQMVQILNLPGEQPYPDADTRPRVDYSRRINKLVPGKNYGRLAVSLMAYQIEGALLSEKGIKLGRWPSLALSAASPALYDSSRENDSEYFNPDQISLYGSLTKSYEFTGSEVRNIETAEQNTRFVKENLRLNMDREAREWERLRNRYRQLLATQEVAEQRLARIRRSDSEASAFGGLVAVRSAQAQLLAARQSKEQLDMQIWIWDESKWN